VFEAYFNDRRFTPSLMQQELVNAGFLGRKTGRGFYRYGENAVAPVPETEQPQVAPATVAIYGNDARAHAIAARIEAGGVVVQRLAAGNKDGACMQCGSATVFFTDGRTATRRARDNAVADTVLLDLALDFSTARRVALARADQCSDAAYAAAVGAFQSAGYAVSRLGDVPGMLVMRTVAMLANEAADAVNQGVCGVQAVDIAMQKGVNYPRGPLAWADDIGPAEVMTVLGHLATTYGEDRYRTSPLIQRKAATGALFHA
jgi:3-hydroxybutyryl-CoA dehydrogenase